jgi:hypothetical protein
MRSRAGTHRSGTHRPRNVLSLGRIVQGRIVQGLHYPRDTSCKGRRVPEKRRESVQIQTKTRCYGIVEIRRSEESREQLTGGGGERIRTGGMHGGGGERRVQQLMRYMVYLGKALP